MGKFSPSLRPMDRTRGYLHVADVLREEIGKLGVSPGDRLPSERELAQLLRISRPSLREALIVLELQGEIDIRVGSGIYLRDEPAAGAPGAQGDRLGDGAVPNAVSDGPVAEAVGAGVSRGRPADPDGACAPTPTPETGEAVLGHSPYDVNQARYFLEGGIAAHAARFMTQSQLKKLKASLNAMRRALDKRSRAGDQPLADADRQFHIVLVETTENRLLIQTMEELFDQRYSPVGGSMHRLFDNRDVWKNAIQEHEDVYEAVAARDPFQAQAAMQRHLARAHARLMAVIGD